MIQAVPNRWSSFEFQNTRQYTGGGEEYEDDDSDDLFTLSCQAIDWLVGLMDELCMERFIF